MKLEPVKKYIKPAYPDKETVMHSPAVLKSMPERWKNNATVCIALTSLISIMLTACGDKFAPNAGADANGTDKKTQTDCHVAPVFEHGQGRGSFGCVSVAPPSFLSEEEAFKVIQEEAVKAGISFETTTPILYRMKVPETKYYLKSENPDYKKDGGVINTTSTRDLVLDGYNAEKNIAFEFVSKQDYDEWSVKESVRSSVEDFDFKTTAELLAKSLDSSNPKVNLGVFYNPMVSYNDEVREALKKESSFEKKEQLMKDMAAEDLRKQVKDFIEWLKAQNII